MKKINHTCEERRRLLIEEMENLQVSQSSCAKCPGYCCTFRSNSMQITPLEALEVYEYLNKKGLWTEEFKTILKKTVRDFRLDYDLPTRKGFNFRRTYTCPFFSDGPLGCSLPQEVKPYGCLGFNPPRTGAVPGENCYSDINLLEKREEVFKEWEDQKNTELERTFQFDTPKKDIPQALLYIEASRIVP